MFCFTKVVSTCVKRQSLLIRRLLSIALIWTIMMSQAWCKFAVQLLRCTLNISASFFTFVVSGRTMVDGCGSLLSRLVCITRTGLVLPGSVPIWGFKSASQISNCLIGIIHLLGIFKYGH